jgi:two-component system KDP operon response regulator KdpE
MSTRQHGPARRILIVDDEPQITRVLRTSISAHGYEVRVANEGQTALQIARDWPPDLMITDLAMPVMDGLELCRRFRQLSNAPIIVLSIKSEEQTKVQAFDAGADDYVTKPFGMNELLARMHANLRRAAQEQKSSGVIAEGDFRIDAEAHKALIRGRELKLTPKEFDLLTYFAQNPRKVITHRELLAAVWGDTSTEQPEYLRVFIGQLRKKIEVGWSSPSYILTEPWVGYRFEPKGTAQQ